MLQRIDRRIAADRLGEIAGRLPELEHASRLTWQLRDSRWISHAVALVVAAEGLASEAEVLFAPADSRTGLGRGSPAPRFEIVVSRFGAGTRQTLASAASA